MRARDEGARDAPGVRASAQSRRGGRGQGAALEAVWVSAGSYALYGAMFGVSILINRVYGTAELGRFGIAWAVAQLTVQAGVAGFSAIHRRDVAYAARSVAELVAETLGVRLLALATLLVVVAVALAAWGVEGPLAWAVGWVAVAKAVEAVGLALAETVQAEGHNRTFALLSAINAAALVLAGGVVAALVVPSRWLYPALVGPAVLYLGAALAAYGRVHGLPAVRLSAPAVRAVVAESWPLMVNALVVVAAARVAVVAVGVLAGETAAGVYTFASGVVGGAAVVATAAGTVLFPRLCTQYVEAPETLRATMWRLVWKLGALGVLAWGALAAARGPLLSVYGDLPPSAGPTLLVLGIGLVAVFGAVAPNYMFTAIRAQNEGMRLAVLNALVLIVLVLPFASRWGALGAAAGVAVSQAIAGGLGLVWLDVRFLGPWARLERRPGAAPPTPALS